MWARAEDERGLRATTETTWSRQWEEVCDSVVSLASKKPHSVPANRDCVAPARSAIVLDDVREKSEMQEGRASETEGVWHLSFAG